MKIDVRRDSLKDIAVDWLLLPVFEGGDLLPEAAALDQALGGLLTRLRETGDLTGKPAETVELRGLTGIAAKRVIAVGLGTEDKLTAAAFDKALMTAVRQATAKLQFSVGVAIPSRSSSRLSSPPAAQIAATALHVGGVGQGLYRTQPERFPPTSAAVIVSNADDAVGAAVERGSILGEAINLTRELINRHPGELYPETFAERARQAAAEVGIDCDILDPARLEQERMGALLGVSRGSDRPPRVVILEYRGAGADAPWLALVGKGVTFDSGGLSLKPSDSMKSMKCDMSGAATVLGAMTAIARLRLPVNVRGALGLVENMTGGSAYKLGEILTARNGVTIEIHNTDAEGRLVLADVLSYAVDRGADRIVDLATLTGACVVALGEEVAGAFTNNQPWCDRVLEAARITGEDVWQLPMFDSFAEQLKSDTADMKNIGSRWGGAITAAKFLERFVSDRPWVHLDIAGPAFAESNKPHKEGGATGALLRTLVQLAESPL